VDAPGYNTGMEFSIYQERGPKACVYQAVYPA